nr:MAG TPA: hypothetical protein [Caudoviricetes sp.]
MFKFSPPFRARFVLVIIIHATCSRVKHIS